jgi:hypothetical protein
MDIKKGVTSDHPFINQGDLKTDLRRNVERPSQRPETTEGFQIMTGSVIATDYGLLVKYILASQL